MNEMLIFCTSMLGAISQFLWSEPIRYIVGFLLCLIVFKIFKLFIHY